MASVLFVCLGNICRSPMAEGIFLKMLADRGLLDRIAVASAGTAAHHAGELPDPRSQAVMARHGEHCPSRAVQVRRSDFERHDLILAMDRSNFHNLLRICPEVHTHKVHLVLEPTTGGEVPDPYYGGAGGFDHVHDLLVGALSAWLGQLEAGAVS